MWRTSKIGNNFWHRSRGTTLVGYFLRAYVSAWLLSTKTGLTFLSPPPGHFSLIDFARTVISLVGRRIVVICDMPRRAKGYTQICGSFVWLAKVSATQRVGVHNRSFTLINNPHFSTLEGASISLPYVYLPTFVYVSLWLYTKCWQLASILFASLSLILLLPFFVLFNRSWWLNWT